VVFHISEILQTFSFVSVPIDEVVFVDFQSKGEDSEEWEKDFVVDVLFSVS
jgi:hypothetical protein